MNTGLQRIGRYVTLKVLYTATQADSDAMQRFRHSVALVASLQHPNIARIRDVLVFPSGNPDSLAASMVCIAVDYIDGQTLDDYLHHVRGGGKIRPGADMV